MQRNTHGLRSKLALAAAAVAVVALAGCSSTPVSGDVVASSNAVVSPPVITKAGTLEVCVNYGTPPNSFTNDAGEPRGAEVDLAIAVAKEMGLEVNFAQYDFGGLIPALQASQCDVIMSSLYIKAEREKVVDFVPYLSSGSGVAVSRENPKGITGYNETLCGVKLLAVVGATGADLAQEKSDECVAQGLEPIDISLSSVNGAGLQQVIAGQVDAFVDTAELAGYYQKLSNGDFTMVGEPFGVIDIGAATRKDNSELHDAIADAFTALAQSGRYAEILAEWGLEKHSILS